MSFQGLASAMLVLIIVGAVLGCLVYVEAKRHLPELEAPTSVESDAALAAPFMKEVGISGSTGTVLSSSLEGPAQREQNLTDREKQLEQDLAEFEARTDAVEKELAEKRQELEQDRADFEEEKKAVEARIQAEHERLEATQQNINQLLNWAVLALCGAGAVTIGNITVVVARSWSKRGESRKPITPQRVSRRRRSRESKQPQIEVRVQDDEGHSGQSDSQDEDSALILWAELMGRRQNALTGANRSGVPRAELGREL